MEPYTVSGMARQDSSAEVGENGRNMDRSLKFYLMELLESKPKLSGFSLSYAVAQFLHNSLKSNSIEMKRQSSLNNPETKSKY